jgi:hypothetical protein
MPHRGRRPISFIISAVLLAPVVAAVAGGPRVALAQQAQPQQTQPQPQQPQPRPLSDAQLSKINGWITDQGRDVALTPIITDILGLTQNNQTLTCHAFGAVDATTNDIRHIYLLPADKGYLIDYFHAQIVEVYWMDKNLTLIAALSGIRGQAPLPISFQQALFGFGNEMGWWAKYADMH